MSHESWVQKAIFGIVIGNLVILSTFFLGPRVQFLVAHTGLTSGQLMETAGSPDMPNLLSNTYAVVNRIRKLTAKEATLFMPPGDRLQGSFRSAAIQILYPRKIFFGGDENFESGLKEAEKIDVSYFVYSSEWKPEFCRKSSRMELTDFGFGMCHLKNERPSRKRTGGPTKIIILKP